MANLLENIVLSIGKVILRSVNIAKHPLYPVYKEYLPIVETSYKKAYYWHGTGRFHYKPKGNSKYEGVDTSQTYDVLQSIIDAGGITPKFDPVLPVNGKYKDSISLTPHRMYGKAYAIFNNYEKINLEYMYGSVKFWYYFLLPLQLFYVNFFTNIKAFAYSYKNKSYDSVQAWLHTFRKPGTFYWTALNFYKVRSDIPHNYGLLFGIKKIGVHHFSFNKTLERFETRADNVVKIEYITHIEVPLNKIKETKLLLRNNKVNIPVIPIEIGELYCNRYSLAYLYGIDRK